MVLKSKTAAKNQSVSTSDEPETRPPTTRPRTRSPARTRSPGRSSGKSPSRTKSPSRKNTSRLKTDTSLPLPTTSTPKVDLPKARSPIRKSGRSPTRTIKTTLTRSAETFANERVQRPRRSRIDVDTDSDNEIAVTSEKPQAAVRGHARRLENLETSGVNALKRFTRSSQSREVERVVHLQHFESVAKKLGEFSDEDDLYKTKKSVSAERGINFQQIREFGGTWGAVFFMLTTPISIMTLLVSCNEFRCSFTQKPDLSKYAVLSAYFDLFSILGFLLFAVALAALSVIPFGGKRVTGMPTKQGKFVYVMNGFFSCFVFIALALALEYRKIRVSDYVANHLFHLLIASIVFGFLLASYAFVRSFYVPLSHLNAYVVGKNKFYGFFMGRELNPRVFRLLDLKMYVFRLALIGSVLLDFVYLYKSLDWTSSPTTQTSFGLKSLNINVTLVVLVLIHSIYYLDALAHEKVFVTSFEIQYEGFGYISAVGYLIYPFMMAAATKYVADYDVKLPVWQLILVGIVFMFGYLLFRGSNNQKDAFRKNPYDPALSHLETIPTTKGKKLLCSGFWGIVRHPNYLGDILMNLAFVPFSLQVPPVLSPLCIVLFLIHRSVRDHERCKQKYGAAWDRYCSKVKNVLIPKVY